MTTGPISGIVGGSRPPKAITNFYSAGGIVSSATIVPTAVMLYGLKAVLSGALTANTLATALSITGAGEIDMLCAYTNDVTSRTVRLKVTIDGTVAFDATSAATTTVNSGVYAIGSSNNTTAYPQRVTFAKSLLVEIASSISETDKLTTAYRYFTL